MTRAQVRVIAITIGLCALDGFDVLAISFASPGIAREWGINRAALGVVLSMELLGMGIGSILLGGVADLFGRRYTVLGCLLVMTIGMVMATTAHSVDRSVGVAAGHRSWHRRHAGVAQCDRLGVRQRPAARPVRVADGDRLSARGDHRRLDRRGAAEPQQLARGVRIRRRGVGTDSCRSLCGGCPNRCCGCASGSRCEPWNA
jgi:hypothetical protein